MNSHMSSLNVYHYYDDFLSIRLVLKCPLKSITTCTSAYFSIYKPKYIAKYIALLTLLNCCLEPLGAVLVNVCHERRCNHRP